MAQLEAGVAAVPAPGGDDPGPALDRLQQGGGQVAAGCLRVRANIRCLQ
ncbi:MAG: hypothetical protein WAM82_36665 [Thermoanaerobaculia bacterium]